MSAQPIALPIPQSELAAYWSDMRRAGFVKPRFDVQVSEYDKRGKFVRGHTAYVCAADASKAKRVGCKYLREYMGVGGRLAPVSVEFSQPVRF